MTMFHNECDDTDEGVLTPVGAQKHHRTTGACLRRDNACHAIHQFTPSAD